MKKNYYYKKTSFYPWKDQLAKDTYEATKTWHLNDWKVFRNKFWVGYYAEKTKHVPFRRRKLEKIREFNLIRRR